MDLPRGCKYTKTHEWVRAMGSSVVVGITDYAQSQLSDVTYVELPEVGEEVSTEEEVAVLESVKAAADVYAPVAGTVIAVNERLEDHPELVNADPYGEGWLFKIKPDDPSEIEGLLDVDHYEELLPQED